MPAEAKNVLSVDSYFLFYVNKYDKSYGESLIADYKHCVLGF